MTEGRAGRGGADRREREGRAGRRAGAGVEILPGGGIEQNVLIPMKVRH